MSLAQLGYREITSQQSMDEMLDEFSGFHDSLIKEIHILNRSYVGPDLSMRIVPSGTYSARVLIQRQFDDPSAVELLCLGITKFVLLDHEFVLSAEGYVESEAEDTPSSLRLVFDDVHTIQCQQLWIRPVSDWMGITPRFGNFIGIDE